MPLKIEIPEWAEPSKIPSSAFAWGFWPEVADLAWIIPLGSESPIPTLPKAASLQILYPLELAPCLKSWSTLVPFTKAEHKILWTKANKLVGLNYPTYADLSGGGKRMVPPMIRLTIVATCILFKIL